MQRKLHRRHLFFDLRILGLQVFYERRDVSAVEHLQEHPVPWLLNMRFLDLGAYAKSTQRFTHFMAKTELM